MLNKRLKFYSTAAIFCSVFLTVVFCVPLVQAGFKPIPNAKVDQAQKKKSQQVVTTLFAKWGKGKFEPLPGDFTAAMKKAMTSDAQKATYGDLKNKYGEFKSIEFVAASSSEKPPKLVMYRFKGVFSGKKSAPEIRILMDKKGKVSGLWFSEPKKRKSK